VAQARLVLRWWADQVELRVNGEPAHAGDLFDTACRWLLPACWWRGEVLQLELRLRSPLHDDGALIESRLELEPLDPADPRALLAETKAELAQLRAGQPPGGGFHVLGHAHLDLAWLWPVADTWQAAERTFASALDLIERFEELHFGHSTPALYAWLEQNRPALFARLQQAVAAGRFEPINGPWVETDCVLISGASLLRQFQLGQHYSAAAFPGLEHPLAWLPDSFGFAAGLPAVAHSTGVRWFCTHKLFWNATNPFPHRLFRWRSRCGADVLALMTAPIGTDGDPVAMERHRLAWQGASGVEEALWLPGVGDHGGGPTAEMLEQLRLWRQQPEAAPQCHGSLRAYLAALEPLAPRLPVWRDELYLELHRGCATSRPDQKRHNRTLERLLREADLAGALAGAEGAEGAEGDRAASHAVEPADWRPLLFQQFHDILPGTSIPEVFEQAEPQWRAARRSACRQRDRALHTWLGGGADWWVAQLQPLPARARTLRLPRGDWSHGGIGLPAQAARAGGQWVQLPALAGVEALPLERPSARFPSSPSRSGPSAAVQAPVWVEGWRCGNGLVSFGLGPGGLEQLWDGAGQPQLAGPLAWRRYADRGEFWDAWDIAANYREHPLDWAWQGEPTWLEQGPLCTTFLWRGRCGASAVRLEGRLLANTPWLELVLSVDWRQRHELLRLEIPLGQPAQRWAADTSGGVLERPAQALTAREQARWEVPAISWLASVAAGGDGLAVLLDGPQGVSASPEQLGVSLLRAPTWPDPGADNGQQRLRLALLPCASGWSRAEVPQQAVAFREPLWLRPAVAQGRADRRQACPPLGDGLLLLGCRPSGDGGAVVLTVQNCSPARRRLELGSAWQLSERLDGLDRPLLGAQATGGDPWQLAPWSLGFWRIRPARD
jgi:alpha-mannosidase